jgi:hypothetical protein
MKPSESEIINTLRSWVLEVESFRNDGWTRYHYLDKLLKVKEYVDKSLSVYEAEREKVNSHKLK